MAESIGSLLTEPLLPITGEGGNRIDVDLPTLLARLARGEPTELAVLRAHQAHP